MRLTRVRIQRFRNFVDAQDIEIEPDVTALVGKNESGKTTVLDALHRLKPANLKTKKFLPVTEYPRWRRSRDRKAAGEGDELDDNTRPVEAWFELDDADRDALAESLGSRPPKGTQCYIARSYRNTRYVALECPLATVIETAADDADVNAADRGDLERARSADDASTAAKELAKSLKSAGEGPRAKALMSFPAAIESYSYLTGAGLLDAAQETAVFGRVPGFFYFSDYDLLPGQADLTDLADKVAANLEMNSSEESVASLLAFANATPTDFLGSDYDARKAELQASALDLTSKVMTYWTQNRDLEVEFDTELEEVDRDPQGRPIMHRMLKIEMRDLRHGGISTNFETRSAGFRWFFSFLASFSRFQESADAIVVLLDEPGTSLHGEAQKDFLRFIHNELGKSKQVIYTTHSQYMVDPTRYEELRAVEDQSTRENPDLGVVVSDVGVSAGRDTLLPVQAALGYAISQHLFLGAGRHLTVEGGSDFLYLQRVSEHLASIGRTGLDPRISIIPLGSVDNTPAYVALFARHMRVSVLLDGDANGKVAQRVYAQADKGLLRRDEIVVLADVAGVVAPKPDIEDLFDEADYLRLYNWAFGKNHRSNQLPAGPERIVRRLESLDAAFDHALPAYALTDHLEQFFQDVKPRTLDRFEDLFKRLNATIAPNE